MSGATAMFTDAMDQIVSLKTQLIGALVGLVLLLALGTGLYQLGFHNATMEAAKAEAVRTATAVQAQKDADARVLHDEQALRTADRETFNTYQKEQDDAQAATTRLITDLRRDVVRLRVPIRPAGPAAQDAGGPAAAGTGDQGHAELTADAGEFLVGLLARGDSAIRKHAAVVDRYERLRAACTADQPLPESTP